LTKIEFFDFLKNNSSFIYIRRKFVPTPFEKAQKILQNGLKMASVAPQVTEILNFKKYLKNI